MHRFPFQGGTRFAVKLDFIAGLMMKALDITGASQFRGVQARLGEVLTYRNLFWALTEAMARDPMPWVDGYVLPNLWAGLTYRVLAPEVYPKIKDIIERDLASASSTSRATPRTSRTPRSAPTWTSTSGATTWTPSPG